MSEETKSKLNPTASAFQPKTPDTVQSVPSPSMPHPGMGPNGMGVPAVPSYQQRSGPLTGPVVGRPQFPAPTMHQAHHHHHHQNAGMGPGFTPQQPAVYSQRPMHVNPQAQQGYPPNNGYGIPPPHAVSPMGHGPNSGPPVMTPSLHHHSHHHPPHAHQHHAHHMQQHMGGPSHYPQGQPSQPSGPMSGGGFYGSQPAPMSTPPSISTIPTPPQLHHHHIHHHVPGPLIQHHAHHHLHNNHAAAPVSAFPDRSMMKAVARIPVALVVLATGLVEAQKSDLCAMIAEQKNFVHICLADELNDEGSVVVSRLEQLEMEVDQHLKEDPNVSGFVIENALCRTKHEMFLVDDILRRLNVRLQNVILLDQSGVNDECDPIKHPVGFEVCAKYVASKIIVLNEGLDNNGNVAKLDAEHAAAFVATPEPLSDALRFPDEELPLRCVSLEANARHTINILKDVSNVLSLPDIYTPPWVNPARVLEYSYFTRRAHFFRSYMATHLLDGERFAVVGHLKHAYLLTGNVGICFRIDDSALPESLKSLLEASSEDSPISFIFSAVVVSTGENRQTVYMNDMLYLNGVKGCERYLYERLQSLKTLFEGVPASSVFQLQPYFDIRDISAQIARETPNVLGVVLVNPGFAFPGSFERLNFVWWLPECKQIEVRLWNGQVKTVNNAQMWFFDAHIIDQEGQETKLKDLPVVIPDDVVSAECINDGNIVDVRQVVDAAGAAAATTKNVKGAKQSLPQQRLTMHKRRLWSIYPTSRVFADVVLGSVPRWSKEGLMKSVAFLPPLQILRHDDLNEKPEFAERD